MIHWLVGAIAAVIFVLFLRSAIPELKSAFGEAVRDAKSDLRTKQAARETGEPLTVQEGEDLLAWYRGNARPALVLRPDPEAEPSAAAARLGGAPWFADGEDWPVGPDGRKLEFIAQYDLARLPSLDRFPDHGVARFFVGPDDIWGVDFDSPDRSNVRVLWHDGPQSGGRREQPSDWGDDEGSPFQSVIARSKGVALSPQAIRDLPDFYSWQLQERLDSHAARPGYQEIENRIFEASESRKYVHKIGGHPTFTQYDFRKRGAYDDLDVVLLAITSDDSIMWGDVGEAVFLIRRADLERRDFSRVAFYWDCH